MPEDRANSYPPLLVRTAASQSLASRVSRALVQALTLPSCLWGLLAVIWAWTLHSEVCPLG